jgi:diaminopimelate decarboxylase
MVDGKHAYVIRARENIADLFSSETILPNKTISM